MTMMSQQQFLTLKATLDAAGVTLVAVSKTQPIERIRALYDAGQRIFGENRVQELLQKKPLLPDDIEWHLIGHLQSNKVRQILPHVTMISSVDSTRLFQQIAEEARRIERVIDILLEIRIAAEATKYGFNPETILDELAEPARQTTEYVRVRGVMGMASFVEDTEQIRSEFRRLRTIFDMLKSGLFAGHGSFNQISMGMSSDYTIAISEGSTMVRLGSVVFGAR